MNFSFIFNNSNKTDNKKEASKLMSDAADSFLKELCKKVLLSIMTIEKKLRSK
ncbi:hypothetical protein [Acinetobacter baumannii]|uniref:hypothetical protein n=1 Tax=Acinetobacter baumannii TaxID=470 RepID=UPI001D0E9402|nr:hypothetical protein [Acinetobacter baumannii]